MRSLKVFARDIIKKPPVIFPWIALFHVLIFFYEVWLYGDMLDTPKGWLQPGWMLVYAVVWIYVCDLRKWAGLTYVGLSLLNLILYFNLTNPFTRDLYCSPLYLIDMLFSFFILFFYKRLD